jgi:hypothetical protein
MDEERKRSLEFLQNQLEVKARVENEEGNAET